MKLFKEFRLDTTNHILWCDEERVLLAPKCFDVLAYLVEHAGRVVTQDEILDAVWSETHVNPEVLRKYILEIRRILGDRHDKPEFIETVPKRGYRFVAGVTDANVAEPPSLAGPHDADAKATEKEVRSETRGSDQEIPSAKGTLWKVVIVPVLVLVAAAGIGGFRFAHNGAKPTSLSDPSIAVLPFADMSPTKDQEYFSDGLADQLIHDLAKVAGLKVVARSSAFQFKGRNEDVRDVGRKLGVANVLEGSVRRDGNHVRITAELIKTDDGFHLWSQTYDREMNDIFAVQDEIAQATTETLQPKLLGSNGRPVPANSRTANPEAYQAYLQANYFSVRGLGKEDLDKALAYTDTAIKFDHQYAPAWALRASVENLMSEGGLTSLAEGFRRARDDAERAIALNPNAASGYLAVAETQIYYDWDWESANACLTKAAALEPGSAEVLLVRSHLSRELGNLDVAIKLYKQVLELDPLRTDSHLGLGYMLYVAGRYDGAQAEVRKALDLNPRAALAHLTLGKVLIATGKPQLALAEVENETLEWGKLTGEALVYHALDREQDSTSAIAELIAKYRTDGAFQIAQAYSFRGETDKAFGWLERAYEQRDAGLPEVKTDPLFTNLHRDRRYTQLLKKLHLFT